MAAHHGHHHEHSHSYPQRNYAPGAKWVKGLTRDRLNNFHGGHYSDLNISSALFTHRVYNEDFVKLRVYDSFLLPGYRLPGSEIVISG